MQSNPTTDLIEVTGNIVAAYLAGNHLPPSELPKLIGDVHGALAGLGAPGAAVPTPVLKPAVDPKKSIHPDYIVCLENGKRFKSLKRHLSSQFGLTPEQYRAKWSLPASYPMVAPNYAAVRSSLAKATGLGHHRPHLQ